MSFPTVFMFARLRGETPLKGAPAHREILWAHFAGLVQSQGPPVLRVLYRSLVGPNGKAMGPRGDASVRSL